MQKKEEIEKYTKKALYAGEIALKMLPVIGNIWLLAENYNLKRSELDKLTGAYTRDKFEKELTNEIIRWVRYRPKKLSISMFDIDNFKKINDNYGHPAGDRILREISDVVKGNIRQPDKLDKLFRLGGDEFMLIFPETDYSGAGVASEKINRAVCNHRFTYFKAGEITVSIGYTDFESVLKNNHYIEEKISKPKLEEKLKIAREIFISCSDTALLEAKRSGKNRVCGYYETAEKLKSAPVIANS
jgi:diguanylate cyclase (GGDEF)-like protein